MSNKIVNEEIKLTSKDLQRLAKCSYYVLRDTVPGFAVSPSGFSGLSPDAGTVDLYELVGELFLQHVEGFWAIQHAEGDCPVSSVKIAQSAYEIIDQISCPGTRALLAGLWPDEFNSRREACWIIGNVVTNEVIVKVMENLIAQKGEQF